MQYSSWLSFPVESIFSNCLDAYILPHMCHRLRPHLARQHNDPSRNVHADISKGGALKTFRSRSRISALAVVTPCLATSTTRVPRGSIARLCSWRNSSALSIAHMHAMHCRQIGHLVEISSRVQGHWNVWGSNKDILVRPHSLGRRLHMSFAVFVCCSPF